MERKRPGHAGLFSERLMWPAKPMWMADRAPSHPNEQCRRYHKQSAKPGRVVMQHQAVEKQWHPRAQGRSHSQVQQRGTLLVISRGFGERHFGQSPKYEASPSDPQDEAADDFNHSSLPFLNDITPLSSRPGGFVTPSPAPGTAASGVPCPPAHYVPQPLARGLADPAAALRNVVRVKQRTSAQ
jgi:hypothetical protein